MKINDAVSYSGTKLHILCHLNLKRISIKFRSMRKQYTVHAYVHITCIIYTYIYTYIHRYRQTDTQIGRQTDIHTDRQTDIQTDKTRFLHLVDINLYTDQILHYLPSQVVPKYPFAHWQVKPSTSSLHVPPFWHGLESHPIIPV